MKIALKELRETLIWLRIIERKELCDPEKLKHITALFSHLGADGGTPDDAGGDTPWRPAANCGSMRVSAARQRARVGHASWFGRTRSQHGPVLLREEAADAER